MALQTIEAHLPPELPEEGDPAELLHTTLASALGTLRDRQRHISRDHERRRLSKALSALNRQFFTQRKRAFAKIKSGDQVTPNMEALKRPHTGELTSDPASILDILADHLGNLAEGPRAGKTGRYLPEETGPLLPVGRGRHPRPLLFGGSTPPIWH